RARLVEQGAVHGVPIGRGLADAARVEHLVRVASIRAAERDAQRRLEEIEALGEEGALLGEERLEGGEVEDALVGLDLAEVRIDRADQGEVARQRVAQIEPGASRRNAVVAHAKGRARREAEWRRRRAGR